MPGELEGYRLPFIRDWAWIRHALRHTPDLAGTYRRLVPGQASRSGQPGCPAITTPSDPVITEQLSDREREVLQLASAMLGTEEIASEMYISVNTVRPISETPTANSEQKDEVRPSAAPGN